MSKSQSDESVHITGEERLHPALRKLGRACIALARWQREQERRPAPSSEPTPDNTTTPNTSVPPAKENDTAASNRGHGYA